MDTICTQCHEWTALPESVPGGNGLRVRCTACAQELPPESIGYRYRACRLCGHHFLRELDFCPVCPDPQDAAGAAAWMRLLLDGDPAANGHRPGPPVVPPLADEYV